MTEWKTLKQLWDEVGGPFDAVHFAENKRFHVVAISPKEEAVGWNSAGEAYWAIATDKFWKLHKPEPKLVPHWLAVYQTDYLPRISSYLYQDIATARRHIVHLGSPSENDIRLATELPPILLPVKE